MSDRSINIQNFRYGFDSRRDVLTSVLGTLAQLQNGFVNGGGEIEQRMSFVKDANAYPTNTFGIEVTSVGLVTFGSDASPNAALPSGITYQRLQYPTNATISMSSVVYSCNYNGNAFVLAKFTDGKIFAYYNGVLVGAFRNGIVLTNSLGTEATTDLANDLAAIVNAIPNWVADANMAVASTGFEAFFPGCVVVKSPPGIHFNPVISSAPAFNTNANSIGSELIDQNGPGTPGVSAVAAFTLTGGGGGDTVFVQYQVTGLIFSSLMPVPAPFDATTAKTASDVAFQINLFSTLTGFSATVSGTTVTVYAPSSFGSFTNVLQITTTGAITASAGSAGSASALVLNPPGLDITKVVPNNIHATTVYGTIQASVPGAVGAVTFAWTETDSAGNNLMPNSPQSSGILLSSTTASRVTFSKTLNVNGAVLGYFKCTATVGGSAGIPVLFTVALEADNTL